MTAVAVSVGSAFQHIAKPREHQLAALGDDIRVTGTLALHTLLLSRVDTVPEFHVLAGLGYDVFSLWFPDSQVFLDKTVSSHHHVDWAAEVPQEIDHALVLRGASPCDVQGPENFAAPAVAFSPQFGAGVGKGTVGFPLRAMLVKGNRVVKGVTELGEDLPLVLAEPHVVEIIAR